jgi:hypothetical protein
VCEKEREREKKGQDGGREGQKKGGRKEFQVTAFEKKSLHGVQDKFFYKRQEPGHKPSFT